MMRHMPGTWPTNILLLALLPIGDTLFTTPTIGTIRDRYPRARITALTHGTTARLLRMMPLVDEVIVLPTGPDWAGPRELLRTLRELRARHFDASVDFSSPAYKWINWTAGIRVSGYMKFDRLWWCVPGQHRWWRSQHATRHYYDCARELRLPPWDEVHHTLRLHIPARDHAAAQTLLAREGIRPGRDLLIGVHPGAAGLNGVKRWPADRFAAVADALAERWGARILLLGGPDETDVANIVASHMRHTPVNAAGSVRLLTSFALIEACDLYIGNDSGLLHAAAALGTPYLGLYGPTNPANFQPVPLHKGQGLILLPPIPCYQPYQFVGGDLVWRRPCCEGVCKALLLVPAERVLAEADELLERRRSLAGAR
jgi:heptosyltransferase-2